MVRRDFSRMRWMGRMIDEKHKENEAKRKKNWLMTRRYVKKM